MSDLKRDYETILVAEKDGIATVAFNRPEKLNAINPKMMQELSSAFSEIMRDFSVKVVILTGTGHAFSAGGDVIEDIRPLRDMNLREWTEYRKFTTNLEQTFLQIVNMDKLVIAAINGLTLGAALELALCCDVRIASEEAQLCEWFVRMGMTPLVGAYFLPRLVGVGRAKLIACTGDFIDAKEAERIGLVDKVVPGDKLMTTVEELARKILDRPIQTVGLIKRGINMSLKMDFESSLEYQSRLFYESVGTEDHRETVDAWIEKRKPILKGK